MYFFPPNLRNLQVQIFVSSYSPSKMEYFWVRPSHQQFLLTPQMILIYLVHRLALGSLCISVHHRHMEIILDQPVFPSMLWGYRKVSILIKAAFYIGWIFGREAQVHLHWLLKYCNTSVITPNPRFHPTYHYSISTEIPKFSYWPCGDFSDLVPVFQVVSVLVGSCPVLY